MCQSKYIKELLPRHPEITEAAVTPYSGWRDAYDETEEREEREEYPDPTEVKINR